MVTLKSKRRYTLCNVIKHNRSLQCYSSLQYLGVLEEGMGVDTLQKRSVVLSALDSARVS